MSAICCSCNSWKQKKRKSPPSIRLSVSPCHFVTFHQLAEIKASRKLVSGLPCNYEKYYHRCSGSFCRFTTYETRLNYPQANTYNLSHARTIKSAKFKNQKDLFSTRVNIFFQKYLHRCDARFLRSGERVASKVAWKKSSELRLFVTSLASLFFLCPTKIKRREALHDDTCSTKIGQRNNRLSKYYF